MMINAARDNLTLLTGSLDLAVSYVQLSSTVQEVLAVLKTGVRNKVVLRDEVPAEALVYCDPDRLKHVVHIALANAIKYTKRGTIQVRPIVHCCAAAARPPSHWAVPDDMSGGCCTPRSPLNKPIVQDTCITGGFVLQSCLDVAERRLVVDVPGAATTANARR
jgi:hypothetical protein